MQLNNFKPPRYLNERKIWYPDRACLLLISHKKCALLVHGWTPSCRWQLPSCWKSWCGKELRALPSPPVWALGFCGAGRHGCCCWGGACLQPQGQSHLGLYSLVALLMLSQRTLKLQGIPMTCGLHKLQGMGFSFRKCILRNTFTDFCPQNEPLVSVCPVLLVQIMNSVTISISP